MRREGESMGVVTPIRLIEFYAMNLNVSLTEKISQRLSAPATLDQVTKAMRNEQLHKAMHITVVFE